MIELNTEELKRLAQVYEHVSCYHDATDAASEDVAVLMAAMPELIAIAERATEVAEKKVSADALADVCKWVYREHDFMYEAACGSMWSFINGNSADNGVNFCQCCGKPVATVDDAIAAEGKP